MSSEWGFDCYLKYSLTEEFLLTVGFLTVSFLGVTLMASMGGALNLVMTPGKLHDVIEWGP